MRGRRKNDDAAVVAELRRICTSNGGILNPKVVVKAAANSTSPLHDYFDWDDTIAAQRWRIVQARNLINVVVEYLPADENRSRPVRVFYSLPKDRTPDGGYRTTVDIISDKARYLSLLEMAKAEMISFTKKYKHVSELEGVIAAMVEVLEPVKRKRKAA